MEISRNKIKQSIPIILAIITLIIFGQVIGFEFLGLDDHTYILDNKFITGDTTWKECLMERFREHNYFPIRNLLYRLQFEIWGENPHVFHFTNLLFYTINVVLVYWFSLSVFRKIDISEDKAIIAAGLTGLFFSIHPLHVESIAWVISLKEPLSSFFYLLTLIFYLKWLDKKKIGLLIAAAVFSLLSIFSKSTAITLIAGLFLFDWLYKRKFSVAIFLDKIPFVIVTLFALYALGFLPYTNQAVDVLFKENRFGYYPEYIKDFPQMIQNIIMMSLRVYFWVSQTIFPYELTALYERDFTLYKFSYVVIVLPFILLSLVALSIFARKKFPFFLLGLFFFFITIAPVLVQSEYGLAVFSPDRYMYFPIWGLLIIFVGFIIGLAKKLYIPILVIYGSFWLFQTLTYLPTWKNTESLFANCLNVNPYCRPALMHESKKQIENKEYGEAIETLNTVLRVGPGKHASTVFLSRAIAYMYLDSIENALSDFDTSLKIDSTLILARLNKGIIFLKKESYEEARFEFGKAYLLDSTNVLLQRNLIKLYSSVKNYPVALKFCYELYRLDSNDYNNNRMIASILFAQRKYDECVSFISEQIERKPDYIPYYELRKMSYLKLGEVDAAESDKATIEAIKNEITVK